MGLRLTDYPLTPFPLDRMLSRTVTGLRAPGKAGAFVARRHISYSQVRQTSGGGGKVKSALGALWLLRLLVYVPRTWQKQRPGAV